MKLLQKIGVENIDVVTLLADSNNPGYNRGFAFLELETYKDAQIAYKKLSRKDVFGKGLNIRVAWAEPLNGPDEKQIHKVSLSLSHTHTHTHTHTFMEAHATRMRRTTHIHGCTHI
jgi:RNA recognition motif-containing protein